MFAHHPRADVRYAVLNNRNVTHDILIVLSRDDNYEIAEAAKRLLLGGTLAAHLPKSDNSKSRTISVTIEKKFVFKSVLLLIILFFAVVGIAQVAGWILNNSDESNIANIETTSSSPSPAEIISPTALDPNQLFTITVEQQSGLKFDQISNTEWFVDSCITSSLVGNDISKFIAEKFVDGQWVPAPDAYITSESPPNFESMCNEGWLHTYIRSSGGGMTLAELQQAGQQQYRVTGPNWSNKILVTVNPPK